MGGRLDAGRANSTIETQGQTSTCLFINFCIHRNVLSAGRPSGGGRTQGGGHVPTGFSLTSLQMRTSPLDLWSVFPIKRRLCVSILTRSSPSKNKEQGWGIVRQTARIVNSPAASSWVTRCNASWEYKAKTNLVKIQEWTKAIGKENTAVISKVK